MLPRSIRDLQAPLLLRRFVQDRENRGLLAAAAVALGFVCMTAVVYGALVAPASARLVELEARHDGLRKSYADAVLFQQQKKTFAGIKAGILTQNDMPLLVKDLVQTARRSGLAVGAVKYEIPAARAGALVRVTFPLPAEGGYSSVKRFLHAVETSSRLVGIQEVGLQSDRGRVKLTLKLVTYIKGQED